MKLGLMMRPVVHATSARISVAPITHFHCRPMRLPALPLPILTQGWKTSSSALRRGGCGAPTLLVIAHQLHK